MDRFESIRWVLLIGMLAAISCSTVATGQHAPSQFPEPITVSTLIEFADRLDLSPEQHVAAIATYDRAMRTYRELRDGPIAAYLAKHHAYSGSFNIYTPSDVRDEARDRRRIEQRFEEMDNVFFAELQDILTSAQLAKLTRLRTAREIARLEPAAQFHNRFRPRVALDTLRVTAEQRERLENVLADYEREYVQLLRKRVDSNRAVMHRTAELLQQQIRSRIAEGHDATVTIRTYEMVRQAARDELDTVPPDTARHLAVRTLDELSRQLVSPQADSLRRDLFVDLFSKEYLLGQDYFTNQVVRLMESAELTDRERQVVDPIAKQLSDGLEALQSQQIEARIRFEATRPTSPYSGPAHEEYLATRSKLSDQARTGRDAAMEQLRIALGDDRVDTVRRIVHTQAREASEYAQLMAWSARWPLPQPISTSQLTQFAAVLGTRAGPHDSLREMYRTYREHIQSILHEAHETLPFDLQHSHPPIGTADLRKIQQTQEHFLARLDLADAAFFDALTAHGFEQKAVDRISRMRQRTVNVEMAVKPNTMRLAHPLDLISVIASHRPAILSSPQCERILSAYEAQADELLADMARRSKRLLQSQDLLRAISNDRVHRGMDTPIPDREQARLDSAEVYRAIAQLQRLSEVTLNALFELLPADDAASLRHQFEEQRFSELLHDPDAMHATMRAALHRLDTSEPVHQRIVEVAGQYTAAYMAIRTALVDLGYAQARNAIQRANPDGATAERRTVLVQEQLEQLRLQEHLMFDRTQLNLRSRTLLQLMLSPEQRERIGLLPLEDRPLRHE